MTVYKNCSKCYNRYTSYIVGTDSDVFQEFISGPNKKNGEIERGSGLCGFCNEKSIWFLNKKVKYETLS